MSSLKNALCNLAMMPMREEPKHRAQMVSMLLFGELYRVLETQEYWHKVSSLHDNYEGWIYSRKPLFVDEDFIEKYNAETPKYSSHALFQSNGLCLPFGSRLPLLAESEFYAGNQKHFYAGSYMESLKNASGEDIVSIAEKFFGTPYLWGGRNIMGIDCSGLTQMCYKICGISIPRDAYQQAKIGEDVKELSEVKAGDLAFFSENNRVTHVGILTGDGHIIHASEWVRKDKIDENGIYNNDLEAYTLKASSIKRIID